MYSGWAAMAASKNSTPTFTILPSRMTALKSFSGSGSVELTVMQLSGLAHTASNTPFSNTRSPCISRMSSSRYSRAQ